MNLKENFQKGLTYDQYVELLDENLNLHQQHYKKFVITPDDEEQIKKIQPLKVLVLTEPWCGDSLAIFPVVRRLVELNENWQMKVLRRDENPQLMDQFLTRNARAVPIFLFLTEDYELLFRFGPRPKAAQAIFEQYREDFKAGKIEKIEVIKKIRTFYAKNRGKAIFEELLDNLKDSKLI